MIGMDNVQPNDRIRRNNDSLLEQRMGQLIAEPYPSLAERLEVIGIWELLHTYTGELFFSELQAACAQLQRMAVGCESLDNDSLTTAWTRLSGMAKKGTPVEVPTEIDDSRYGIDPSYNTPQQQRIYDWLSHAMELLDRALGGGAFGLQAFVVAGHLPSKLAAEVQSRASREWFGSLSSIGEALWTEGSFGSQDQKLYVLDILAQGVSESLEQLNAADSDDEKCKARGRLGFYWPLLKGAVYKLAYGFDGHGFVAALTKREATVEAVEAALTAGLRALSENEPSTPNWQGHGHPESELAVTTDVLNRLHRRRGRPN